MILTGHIMTLFQELEIASNKPKSEDDMDDNGMSRYMENDDEEGWD